MKKSTKMLKRAACLFLVVLMSIDSLAAIISDSDGSAFVSKSDFEALKTNFATQIKLYEASIDNKIDGAIASYVDGIKVAMNPTNLIEKFETSTGKKMKWLYVLPGNGKSSRTSEINITSTGHLTRDSVSNFVYEIGAWLTSWHVGGEPATLGSGYPLSVLMFGSHTFNTRTGYGDWALAQCTPGVHAAEEYWSLLGSNWTSYTTSNANQATYAKYNATSSAKNRVSTGDGNGWLYQNLNGLNVLKYYCTAIYPKIDLDYYVHWYKSFPASTHATYTSSTGFSFSDVSVPALSVLTLEMGKTKSLGTKYGNGSENIGKFISGSAALIKITNGENYLDTVWGLTTNPTIYVNNEDYNGTTASSNSTTIWPTDLKWNNQYYSSNGLVTFQSSYPSTTTSYKTVTYAPETKSFNTFGNSTLTTIAGEQVLNGEGAPCMEVESAGINVNIKLKLATTSGTANCVVTFSDGKFNNGSIGSGSSTLLSTTITTGVESNLTLETSKKGVIYMWIKNNTNNNPITVETFECR